MKQIMFIGFEGAFAPGRCREVVEKLLKEGLQVRHAGVWFDGSLHPALGTPADLQEDLALLGSQVVCVMSEDNTAGPAPKPLKKKKGAAVTDGLGTGLTGGHEPPLEEKASDAPLDPAAKTDEGREPDKYEPPPAGQTGGEGM